MAKRHIVGQIAETDQKVVQRGGEIDWTKTEVSREEAYSINLVDEFHGGCDMKEQED